MLACKIEQLASITTLLIKPFFENLIKDPEIC